MQPINPKIYHIVHIDKLQSIINSGGLLSDSEVIARGFSSTNQTVYQQVLNIISNANHKPYVEIKNDWYY